MTADPPAITRELAQRTLDVLLLSATTAGHMAQRVTSEHRGNCTHLSCTPACDAFGALVAEWAEILDALDAEQPAQLNLLDETS